tara:strand:- start:7685 stop:7834 length:150 start_codon:yes stop_codon:yes gene_type:complete
MKMTQINGKRFKFPAVTACAIYAKPVKITLVKSDVDCGHCLKLLSKRKG